MGLFIADVKVDVEGHGPVTVDISYGGAFYAILAAQQLGVDVKTSSTSCLITATTKLKGIVDVFD